MLFELMLPLPDMSEIKREIPEIPLRTICACVQGGFWHNPMMQLLISLTMPFHALDNDHFACFFLENLQTFDFEPESLNISYAIYFLEHMEAHLETNENELMKKLWVFSGSNNDRENTCKVVQIKLAMRILTCKYYSQYPDRVYRIFLIFSASVTMTIYLRKDSRPYELSSI